MYYYHKCSQCLLTLISIDYSIYICIRSDKLFLASVTYADNVVFETKFGTLQMNKGIKLHAYNYVSARGGSLLNSYLNIFALVFGKFDAFGALKDRP